MPGPFRPLLQALVLGAVLVPQAAFGQSSDAPQPSSSTRSTPAAQTSGSPQADDGRTPRRHFDAVTVSATLNEREVRETPGTVSVIDAATIEREMVENIADLVRFEPGVYVETTPGGVGLNGFNIRGIGGNRVMTQIDGVETAEQFDFGPFNMHRQAIDPDTLKSAEIVRSAGSSLYGSDALGGVVSFFTKDPADYLRGRRFSAAGRTSFDGRMGEATGNVAIAGGGPRVEASLFVSYGQGHELGNRGTVVSEDASRTAPNPQDRSRTQTLGKVVVRLAPGNVLRGTIETAD